MAIETTADVTVVNTPHGRVRVRDTGGNGLPVLLVHALLVDPDLYATLVPLLTDRGYRCLVPELPMGAHQIPVEVEADLTPPGLAQLLVEVLDALSIDRVDVVGVDTGGALTQLLMAQHRDRVRHVVLTGCDAYDAFPPPAFAPVVKLLRLPGALSLLAQGGRVKPLRRLGTLRPVTHRGVDDATLTRWTRPLRDAGVRRDLGKVLADMNPRHTQAAAEANRTFSGRVLIAWGGDDGVFPRRLAGRLAVALPHARHVTLPDCAAFAAIDQPERLAVLIDEHLRERD